MAYHNSQAGPSSHNEAFPNFDHQGTNSHRQQGPQFDIFEWYPEYQSCHKYFLDHAQHTLPVQALAAFVNITLPYQRQPHPVISSNTNSPSLPLPNQRPQSNAPLFPQHTHQANAAQSISLIPYIRRLIATGHDFPGILHGLFGDNWEKGIGPLQEIERRNYLFAAKSGGWASVKAAYDMPPNEFVPFLQPLRNPSESEVQAAEESWSDWLKMVS